MEYREFGLTQREVAVVGKGTWNLKQDDRAQAIAALRTGSLKAYGKSMV